MTIHPPKHISSATGMGYNTEKHLEWLSSSLAIGTEVWGNLPKPWYQDDVCIAQAGYMWRTRWEVGKPYVVTRFMNDKGELVGIYCDICRPVEKVGTGCTFVDLYLDVWQVPGAKPVILDEDELDEAITAGYVASAEAAATQRHAQEVRQALENDSNFANF